MSRIIGQWIDVSPASSSERLLLAAAACAYVAQMNEEL